MLKQVHNTTSRQTEKNVANTNSEDCQTKQGWLIKSEV